MKAKFVFFSHSIIIFYGIIRKQYAVFYGSISKTRKTYVELRDT